ncbi:hypothetical protein SAMD00019534_052260, partial [Acytostelium subglobosum LB1]|uniref:hypothetical protein n=1 Tax=Acytostelium subglobosum LB1 TaxID=1410327 RepID=UPI000644BD02
NNDIDNVETSSKSLPSSVRYILGSEVCERYSYYGIRSVMVLYLTSFMGYSDDSATSILHGFNFVAYFLPMFGAYVADSILGKYNTILYFSLVYSVGGVFLAISAVPAIMGDMPSERSPWAWIIGLILIGVGTGGIKPVVSTFCGDQLDNSQKDLVQRLYQLFYFAINIGASLSTFLTPLFRTYIGYWFAFGLPSVLIIAATVVFVLGSRSYKRRPITGSILLTSAKVIGCAISEKVRLMRSGSSSYCVHWLDRARVKYDSHLVDSVKAALNVLLVFVPLPFFWAISDQSGSRWTLQAKQMDLRIGSYNMPADQVQSAEPILVMLFIPFIEYLIYRPLRTRNIEFHPLRRLWIGMWISVLSFVFTIMLQLKIDNSPPNTVSVLLQLPQYLAITFAEVLISVTGLEFAYSQAPANMKSTIMSMWLFSIALGNMFVVIVVDGISMDKRWQEFLLYACVMSLATIVFMVIAFRFKEADVSIINYRDDVDDIDGADDRSSKPGSEHGSGGIGVVVDDDEVDDHTSLVQSSNTYQLIT